MPVRKDHYRVLGVAPMASLEEIQRAYRTLSKQHHPDLNQDKREMANDKMQELVEAYTALNNVQSRKDYDSQPHFQIRKEDQRNRPGKRSKVKVPMPSSSFFSRLGAMLGGQKKAPEGKNDPRQKAQQHFAMGVSMVDYKSFLEGAKKEFQLSSSLDPEFIDAHYNLGIVCYRLGEYDQAVSALQKVLTLNRNDRDAQTLIQILRDHEY
ncbi:MAG: DnaJ domain-containing protein [Candidatus Xenobia bacterium]